jgi:hypothetical protein
MDTYSWVLLICSQYLINGPFLKCGAPYLWSVRHRLNEAIRALLNSLDFHSLMLMFLIKCIHEFADTGMCFWITTTTDPKTATIGYMQTSLVHLCYLTIIIEVTIKVCVCVWHCKDFKNGCKYLLELVVFKYSNFKHKKEKKYMHVFSGSLHVERMHIANTFSSIEISTHNLS